MKPDNVMTPISSKIHNVPKRRTTSVVRVSRELADTLLAIAQQHRLNVHAVASAFLRDSVERYHKIDGCSPTHEVAVAAPSQNAGD